MIDKIVPIKPGEVYLPPKQLGLKDDTAKTDAKLSSQVTIGLPQTDKKPPFRSIREAFFWADEDEKLRMIWNVAKMDTVNSVSKDVMHMMLKYLADMTLEETQ